MSLTSMFHVVRPGPTVCELQTAIPGACLRIWAPKVSVIYLAATTLHDRNH